MDVVTTYGLLMHSMWLVPLLVVLVAVDGPFPVLPSETLLISASAVAFGSHDVGLLVGLFLAALVGSAAGDLMVFGLGRGSHRILPRAAGAECALARWVRGHVLCRPGTALIGARFLPGGRLVSTAAAGRFGLPARRFFGWSLASSALWSAYMLGLGVVIGPITGGRPLPSLLAGVVIAVLTAAGFAGASRVRTWRASAPVTC